MASLRALSAMASTAGAISGEATTFNGTESPPHGPLKGSRPLRSATTEPAATARTRAVEMTTVRRRELVRAPVVSGSKPSGKL